jgi:hypothetical protein
MSFVVPYSRLFAPAFLAEDSPSSSCAIVNLCANLSFLLTERLINSPFPGNLSPNVFLHASFSHAAVIRLIESSPKSHGGHLVGSWGLTPRIWDYLKKEGSTEGNRSSGRRILDRLVDVASWMFSQGGNSAPSEARKRGWGRIPQEAR